MAKIVLPSGIVNDAVRVETAASSDDEGPNCSSSEQEKNRQLRQYCDSMWEIWGVIPKPPATDLKPINECYDSSLDRFESVLEHCPEGLLILPLQLARLGLRGVHNAQARNSSPDFILSHGTREQVAALLTENQIRGQCQGIANDQDLRRLRGQLCPAPAVASEDPCPESINQEWMDLTRQAEECRRQFRRVWHLDPSYSQLVNQQTEAIMKEREAQAGERARHQSLLDQVQKHCDPILNPYQNLYLRILAPSLFLSEELENWVAPDPETVRRYNQCVAQKAQGHRDIIESLQRGVGSLFTQLVGTELSSVACYKREIRIELQCQIAGGLLPPSAAFLKRTGHSVIRRVGGATQRLRPSASNIVQGLKEQLARNIDSLGRLARRSRAPEIIAARQAFFKGQLIANLMFPQTGEVIHAYGVASFFKNSVPASRYLTPLDESELTKMVTAANNTHTKHGVRRMVSAQRVDEVFNRYSLSTPRRATRALAILAHSESKRRPPRLNLSMVERAFNQDRSAVQIFDSIRRAQPQAGVGYLEAVGEALQASLRSPKLREISNRWRDIATRLRDRRFDQELIRADFRSVIREYRSAMEANLIEKFPELNQNVSVLELTEEVPGFTTRSHATSQSYAAWLIDSFIYQ
ncbi:MAG: hypothetical protein AAF202_05450 [Pseudomonadota bacterium]